MKSETEHFNKWLAERMKEANFTPKEMAEFIKWLMSRRLEPDKRAGAKAEGCAPKAPNIMAWLKGRASDRR